MDAERWPQRRTGTRIEELANHFVESSWEATYTHLILGPWKELRCVDLLGFAEIFEHISSALNFVIVLKTERPSMSRNVIGCYFRVAGKCLLLLKM